MHTFSTHYYRKSRVLIPFILSERIMKINLINMEHEKNAHYLASRPVPLSRLYQNETQSRSPYPEQVRRFFIQHFIIPEGKKTSNLLFLKTKKERRGIRSVYLITTITEDA
jgi:hypothetical protein